jgi:uncharacterized membrane protein
MSIDPITLLVVAGMAAVTFGVRVAGLPLASRFAPTGRMRAAFDAIPPAVLTAVIAPMALATGPAETIAAAAAALAATRLPLLATIAVGVGAVLIVRGFGL